MKGYPLSMYVEVKCEETAKERRGDVKCQDGEKGKGVWERMRKAVNLVKR